MSNRIYISAAVASISLLGASHANAAVDSAYAYAQQTVSNLTVSGSSITAGTSGVTGTTTAASAAANGSGVATNGTSDAPEAIVLGAPAPQNSFVKYSVAGGGAHAGDFSRGDVLVSNGGNLFTNGVSGSVVAETYADGLNGLQTSTATWQVGGTFTGPTTGTLTVNYTFANDIVAQVAGTTVAPANSLFGLLISLKDQHGHEVDTIPTELNTAFAAPLNGPELITSGSGSAVLSLAGLTAGDTYTISIGSNAYSAGGTLVPEPATLSALALGGAGLVARRRKC